MALAEVNIDRVISICAIIIPVIIGVIGNIIPYSL